MYRKLHMFDVVVDGPATPSPTASEPGDDVVLTTAADGTEIGMSSATTSAFPSSTANSPLAEPRCWRFPSAFTLATTRDHWEVLLRARAIENSAFVLAANQIGVNGTGGRSGGRSMIVDPWGIVLAVAPDREAVVRRRARSRCPARYPPAAPVARPPPRLRLRRDGLDRDTRLMATAAVDKRRMILDAAIRVFARQGFHTCRVSDIADEAGVAYGLVYHYFSSKEQILDTLFLERWDVMLQAIAETDASELSAAREAVRDRVVHHRLLPPRPRS